MYKLTKKEINELFHELDIPIDEGDFYESFGVWEVPPITKDMRLYREMG